jgi:hypothetical protein
MLNWEKSKDDYVYIPPDSTNFEIPKQFLTFTKNGIEEDFLFYDSGPD